MARGSDDERELAALEIRLKTMLPELYQDRCDDVRPVSMGSAGLKFGADGKVAWNQMWASFCDLAMAGGPPHKGTLLEPASQAEIDADPDGYDRVVHEICRGVRMVTELPVQPSPVPGWVRVGCLSESMASWLMRAIVMENVSARTSGATLDLPAGPHYRLEKEIKNVVTVIAKTSHYLLAHMSRPQQKKVAALFETMAIDMPLIVPALLDDDVMNDRVRGLADRMAEAVVRETELRASPHRCVGWLGVECPTVAVAIWMMRALVASNVISRREGTVLCVPVNPVSDADGSVVGRRLASVQRLTPTLASK